MARYERTFRAMGSSFYLCVDTSIAAVHAENLFDQLQQRTEQLEQVMSRFRPNSELVQLNQHVGQMVRVSQTLRQVLDLAALFHHVSGGAFDPRVIDHLEQIGYKGAPIAPTVAVSDIGPGTQTWPDDPEDTTPVQPQLTVPPTEEQDDTFNNPLFVSTGHGVCLHHAVDLGGIGKGYAADSLADLLASSIAPSERYGFIVDAGGDIVLSGNQETGVGWSIGIEDPYGNAGDLAAAVEFPPGLERIAMCTSSLKKRSWNLEGQTVHHLIDPQQAAPARTKFRAVTAVGPTAAHTEVFTKCKMIATTVPTESVPGTAGMSANADPARSGQRLSDEPESGYSWRGTPLPYIAIDVSKTLQYTSDIAPIVTWISTKYQQARVV